MAVVLTHWANSQELWILREGVDKLKQDEGNKSTKQRDEEWVERKKNKWQMLKNSRKCKEGEEN